MAAVAQMGKSKRIKSSATDKVELAAQWWLNPHDPARPRCVVLVVHGIHQNGRLYRPKTQGGCSALVDELCTCTSSLYPGFAVRFFKKTSGMHGSALGPGGLGRRALHLHAFVPFRVGRSMSPAPRGVFVSCCGSVLHRLRVQLFKDFFAPRCCRITNIFPHVESASQLLCMGWSYAASCSRFDPQWC